ncbi:hypothetical protein IKQ26_05460 [bacterium]|nr:hypothetical protein [bacterium]
MIKTFEHNNETLALVIKKDYSAEGIKFFTKDDAPQQIGYMEHKKGYKILPHVHNVVKREISLTQETLVIRKGTLRLDLYSKEREYLESTILSEGDVAILISGGHGLVCLDNVEMIEVKQGPYLGINDKIRISEVSDGEVVLNN